MEALGAAATRRNHDELVLIVIVDTKDGPRLRVRVIFNLLPDVGDLAEINVAHIECLWGSALWGMPKPR